MCTLAVLLAAVAHRCKVSRACRQCQLSWRARLRQLCPPRSRLCWRCERSARGLGPSQQNVLVAVAAAPTGHAPSTWPLATLAQRQSRVRGNPRGRAAGRASRVPRAAQGRCAQRPQPPRRSPNAVSGAAMRSRPPHRQCRAATKVTAERRSYSRSFSSSRRACARRRPRDGACARDSTREPPHCAVVTAAGASENTHLCGCT